MSHHVTAMSCASLLSIKEKEKEIQKKRNIKSRKIDKRKRKILLSKAFHNRYLVHSHKYLHLFLDKFPYLI